MEFKKVLLKIEKVFLFFNFFFAALLLSSYLATFLSPQKFWPLSFLSLVYPGLLIINLFFCIYWAIRLKKFFLISAISVIMGFNILLNGIGFNFFSAASLSTQHLRLMTYNVHNFRTLDLPYTKPAYKPIFELIGSNQPDVLGIEEFYYQSSAYEVCDSLKKILNTSQYYFAPFVKNVVDSTGLAIFSKYPIVHRGLVGLSTEQSDNQAIYVDVQYKSQIIRIYDFHLHSLELDQRDYFLLKNFYRPKAVTWTGIKKIFLKLKDGNAIRGNQADLIRQHAARCPYPYVFMGDFNDTPSSYTFNQLVRGMKNTFKERGTGLGKTFNGGFASLQLDYILVSPQFKVNDYKSIHKLVSDHYPLYSDVALK
jgi:endonuclease/exonuclease/phosphatase family metal-dependent hydrolase